MNNFVIYVKLEKYLSQWLTNALGSPVRFPAQSNENAVIRRFLQKLPKDKAPIMASEELTPIFIPDSKAKDPRLFNYFGPRAQEALTEAIEDLFRRNLWAELGDLHPRRLGGGARPVPADLPAGDAAASEPPDRGGGDGPGDPGGVRR